MSDEFVVPSEFELTPESTNTGDWSDEGEPQTEDDLVDATGGDTPDVIQMDVPFPEAQRQAPQNSVAPFPPSPVTQGPSRSAPYSNIKDSLYFSEMARFKQTRKIKNRQTTGRGKQPRQNIASKPIRKEVRGAI